MDREIITSLPKIELHLHLDCSLSYDVVKLLRSDISESEYKENFIAPEKCENLADCLKGTSSVKELMSRRWQQDELEGKITTAYGKRQEGFWGEMDKDLISHFKQKIEAP